MTREGVRYSSAICSMATSTSMAGKRVRLRHTLLPQARRRVVVEARRYTIHCHAEEAFLTSTQHHHLPHRLATWQIPGSFLVVEVLALIALFSSTQPDSPAAPFALFWVLVAITVAIGFVQFVMTSGSGIRRASRKVTRPDALSVWLFYSLEVTEGAGSTDPTVHRHGWITMYPDELEIWVSWGRRQVLSVSREQLVSARRVGRDLSPSYPVLELLLRDGSAVSATIISPPPSLGVGASSRYIDEICGRLLEFA